MVGSITEGQGEVRLDADMILRKIVADFEQLDGELVAAITLLEAGEGSIEEVESLRRARAAAQKGAALAQSQVGSRQAT